ncbi:MLO-like protein 8, partial [Mucuna pruriens]
MSVSNYKKLFLCLVSWLCCGSVAVASSESSGGSKNLDQTPTWALACVCTVFILISITLEKSLHRVGTWLREKHKKALLEALEKVKAELMILGFLSLLLTFGQSYIVRICIPVNVADKLLPCPYSGSDKASSSESEEEHRRKLLSYERRYLSDDASSYHCKEGYQPLISVNGLHQLHILIFFLAVLHVLYSAVTMLLGRLKNPKLGTNPMTSSLLWKRDVGRFSGWNFLFEDGRHGKRRLHLMGMSLPMGCFFRQFYRSVGKADYLALRNGFITVHLAPGSKFNFQKYIKRSLEDDFKIILAVGTKLQATLAMMAIEITERHQVVQGIPLVQGSDRYFWFGRPQLVFKWIPLSRIMNKCLANGTDTPCIIAQYSFGLKNCFHADTELAIVKVALGFGVLGLCSYITLPLYALVTQMGSRMKKSIFDEQTSKALKKWHMAVKKKQGVKLGNSRVQAMDGSTTDSTRRSSGPTLHRFKTTGHSTRTMSTYDDQDDYQSDTELSPISPATSLIVRVDHDEQEPNENEHPATANNQ